MTEKDKSRKPILYIAQPHFKEPNLQMQSQYTSNSEQRFNLNSDATVVADKARTTNKRNISYVEEEEFIFEEKNNSMEKKVEEKQPQKPIPVSAADYFRSQAQKNSPAKGGLNPVKSFITMTIDEKLQYLLKSKFYSCTFSTSDKRITGKLHTVNQHHIVVKTDSGELMEIGKKELIGIRINA